MKKKTQNKKSKNNNILIESFLNLSHDIRYGNQSGLPRINKDAQFQMSQRLKLIKNLKGPSKDHFEIKKI